MFVRRGQSVQALLSAIIILTTGLLPHASAQDKKSDIERFMLEYGRAAPQIESFYGRLRGDFKIVRQSGVKLQKELIDEGEFNIDHGMSKVSILRSLNAGEKGERHEFVYCVAPNYSFTIIRRPGEKTFDVRGIGGDQSDKVSYINKFGRFLSAPFSVLGNPLSKIMKIEGFQIISAAQIKPDRFELEYLIGTSPVKDKVKLVLDPSQGWVIKSGLILPAAAGGKARIEFQVDYQEGDMIPLPKQVKFRDPTLLETTCDFTSITTEPTDRAEFSMTFYGLPEMAGSRRNRNESVIPILIVLSMLGAMLGVGLRYRSKRRIAKPID